MACEPGEYHPYAACVMFRQVRNGDKVRSYLHQIMDRGRELEQLGLPNTATLGQHAAASLKARAKETSSDHAG